IATALVFVAIPVTAPAQDAAATKATFDSVNKHLDLGGQVYGFLNIQGDFTSLTAKAQELYQQIHEMSGGEIPLPPNFDVAALLNQFGFDNLDAVGLSSIKFEKGFRNRVFAAVDGERKGLLRLTGGDPVPFQIGNFAPATSIVAMEWHLNFAAIKDLITGIGEQLEKSIGTDPLSGALQQPIPGTELNVEQLLDLLKGQFMVYVTLDEAKNLTLPDNDLNLEIPGIDVVLSHNNGRAIYGHLKSFISSNAPPEAFTEETKDGVSRLTINIPEDENLGFYTPFFQMEEGSDRLLIGSRIEALKTLTGGERLSKNAEFHYVASLLPQEGTAYSYTSKRLYEFIGKFVKAASQGDQKLATVQNEFVQMFCGEPQAMAGMVANLKDGIYSESVAPMSYKLSLAYVAIVPVAFMAAVATPIIGKARMKARDVQRAKAGDDAADPFQ
ncbi:MAG: hypothetical protein ACKVHP_26555, partial [Verrucomicrobiales bacterium]